MMAAVIYLAGIVELEGWPVYLYLQANLVSEGASASLVPLVVGLSGAALLTVLAVWLPLNAGIKRVRSLDA